MRLIVTSHWQKWYQKFGKPHRSYFLKSLLGIKFYINLFHDTPKNVCRTWNFDYICRIIQVYPCLVDIVNYGSVELYPVFRNLDNFESHGDWRYKRSCLPYILTSTIFGRAWGVVLSRVMGLSRTSKTDNPNSLTLSFYTNLSCWG